MHTAFMRTTGITTQDVLEPVWLASNAPAFVGEALAVVEAETTETYGGG